MKWKTLESKIDYKNKFFKVSKKRCEIPDGRIVKEYFTVEKGDVVAVVALVGEKQMILVRQYRLPVDFVGYEIPAGYIDKDESPLAAAKRELQEETGFISEKWKKLKEVFASTGSMDTTIHLFLAQDCKVVSKQNLDDSEDIEVHVLDFEKVLDLYENGEIKDLDSCFGIECAKKIFKL